MNRDSRILFGLLLFNGISPVGGGFALMTGLIPRQAPWIVHTDFSGLYFPGVILMAIVGAVPCLPRWRWSNAVPDGSCAAS